LVGIFGIGIATGFYEPTVFTSIAKVLPEEGSDAAFTLTSLVFQFVLFAAPFGFGFIHDQMDDNYDLVFVLCSLVGVFNVSLTAWLSFLSPELQNKPDDVDEKSPTELRLEIFNNTTFSLNFVGSAAFAASCIFMMIKNPPHWLGILAGEYSRLVSAFCMITGVGAFLSCFVN